MADIPIRDYIDTRIKSVEDKLDSLSHFNAQHFELNELAIKKAEESMLIRLEGMNEFREQLNKERTFYVIRETWDFTVDIINSRLTKLEMASTFSAGKMWMVMAIFASIPTIIAIIALISK